MRGDPEGNCDGDPRRRLPVHQIHPDRLGPVRALQGPGPGCVCGRLPQERRHGAQGPLENQRGHLQDPRGCAERVRQARLQGSCGGQPRQHQLPDPKHSRAQYPKEELHLSHQT